MISREDILKLDTRKDIYSYILNHPGLHLRELSRRINIPLGSLRYHIRYLKKYELIVTKNDLKYNRFYIKQSIGNKDKDILNLFRQEIPLRIIIMLLLPGPGGIYKTEETYRMALLKPKTLKKIYSKKEIIELTKNWKYSDHFHILKHPTTIGFHLQKLLDADLIEQIKIGREIKYKLKDENMIKAFLIKYKDALSKKSVNDMIGFWNKNGWKDGIDRLQNILWEIFPHPYHA